VVALPRCRSASAVVARTRASSSAPASTTLMRCDPVGDETPEVGVVAQHATTSTPPPPAASRCPATTSPRPCHVRRRRSDQRRQEAAGAPSLRERRIAHEVVVGRVFAGTGGRREHAPAPPNAHGGGGRQHTRVELAETGTRAVVALVSIHQAGTEVPILTAWHRFLPLLELSWRPSSRLR
jgi:hypothetical protein